jgi:hypothetical protein
MSMASARDSFGERRRRVGAAKQPVVKPMWPLLAFMFGGVWLAWPWFLLNEYLMRSDDLQRQAKTVLVGLLGSIVFAFLVITLLEMEILELREARYAYLVMLTWKLGISYTLHSRQSQSFELWSYFGGLGRNGAMVAIGGSIAAPMLFERIPFGLLWLVLR